MPPKGRFRELGGDLRAVARATLVLLLGGVPAAGQVLEPRELEPLPGQLEAAADGLNNLGQTVGQSGPFAVRWDGIDPVALDHAPGATVSTAFAINDSGVAVGSSEGYPSPGPGMGPAVSRVPVRWVGTSAIVLESLEPLPNYQATAAAHAINASGEIVGYVSNGIGTHPARWNGTSLTLLDRLPDSGEGRAYGINASGRAVGISGREETPVRWDGTAVTALPFLPGERWGAAFAINDANQVAGHSGPFAVRWDGDVPTKLDHAPGEDWSRAFAINSSGQVVGQSGSFAVRWEGTQPTVLGNLAGATGSVARAINPFGHVAGSSFSGSPPEEGSASAVVWLPAGCGDGAVDEGEECDDGDRIETDACRNDCTASFCGDGVSWNGEEWCDDGNETPGDGCEPDCTITPESAAGTAAAGETITTDGEGDGATAADPVETSVTTPHEATVSISETTAAGEAPSGFRFVGQQVELTIDPPGTPEAPFAVVFLLHDSQIPEGVDETTIEVSKDGVAVPPCGGPAGHADPDPCVSGRERTPSGNVKLTILTSSGSVWRMAVATACGNRIVESGEDCDQGLRNGSPSGCCASDCRFASEGRDCGDGDPCTLDQCGQGICHRTGLTLESPLVAPEQTLQCVVRTVNTVLP